MITRCPACHTLFRVVPDQLRMSDGWVRCGQCEEVFDGAAHLQKIRLKTETPAADSGAASQSADEPLTEKVRSTSDDLVEPPPAELEAGPALDIGSFDSASNQPIAAVDNAVEPIVEATVQTSVGAAAGASPRKAKKLLRARRASPERANQFPDASFLRRPSAPLASRRPWRQFALGLSILGLVLSLMGQVLLHERDTLAAWEPALTPGLKALCESLGCAVAAPRRPDAIQIDSAAFTKIRPDAYSLNFVLKNTATGVNALPAIELTLTDALDQPLVRRVYSAVELGRRDEVLAAGAEWHSALLLSVKTAELQRPVAAYRLLAFYP